MSLTRCGARSEEVGSFFYGWLKFCKNSVIVIINEPIQTQRFCVGRKIESKNTDLTRVIYVSVVCDSSVCVVDYGFVLIMVDIYALPEAQTLTLSKDINSSIRFGTKDFLKFKQFVN